MPESNFSGSSAYTGILNVNSTGGWELVVRKNSGSGYYTTGAQSWSVSINGATFSGTWTYDFRSYSSRRIAGQDTHGNYPRPALGQNVGASWSVNMDSGLGNSSGSFAFWADGTASPPGQVPWTSATAVTTNSFTANWGAPAANGAAITNYDLHITRTPAHDPAGAAFYNWTGSTATSKSFTGQPRGTKFYISVRAQNGAGDGAWSPWSSFTTLHTVPDQPPAIVLNSKTSTSANVTIADPAYTGGGITDREVQLSTTSDFTSGVTTLPDPAQLTFDVNNLTRNTQYSLRHRVYSSVGWSAWSDTLTFTTPVDAPTAPAGYSPTDIASTTAYSGLPYVADNGGGPLAALRIEYNSSASSTGATIVTTNAYFPAFMSNLAAGATTYYRMAVRNSGEGAAWSAWGEWVSFVTKSNVPSPPGTPTISAIGNNAATAAWTAPGNLYGSTLTGYTVRVAPTPSFASATEWAVGAAVLSKVMDGLQPGTTYYVQVFANSNNGIGSYSAIAQFTTTGTAPNPAAVWTRVAGVWRSGTLYLKVAGVWKPVVPWQRIGGVWRKL